MNDSERQQVALSAAIRCLDCRAPMTWAAQRRQFGRLLRLGLTPEEAKKLMPRCQKCVTRAITSGSAVARECEQGAQ